MAIIEFPPPSCASEEGLVAIGGDFEVSSLVLAYSQGIFPWPISKNYPLAWFTPDPRGILEYDNLHISKSMRKILKGNIFEVRYDTNFPEVIRKCQNNRSRSSSTPGGWITDQLLEAYIALFGAGFAYSVETYLDNQLVGGLYGVKLKNYRSGESMFYEVANSSKYGLIKLMESLHLEGIDWLDTQMITPVVRKLGGKEIKRQLFLEMLAKSLK